MIDLNGIVKSLAIRAAASALRAAGVRDFCLNAGGDVEVSGTQHAQPWSIGIVDPAARSQLLCSVTLTGARRAVATSGTAERGDHIWRTGTAEFVQVTVIADDMVEADVLATAIVSGGHAFLADALQRWSVDVLTVTATGSLTATPGFRAALAA